MSFLQRLQDILGVADDLPYDEGDYVEAGQPDASNVVEMPGLAASQSELVVMEPRSFEEVPEAILALRDRKAVILNLNQMDADQAQRSVDYVAGGVFAMDGHQERVNQNVFLFTPASVQISNYPVGAFYPTASPQGVLGLGQETDEQRMLKRLNIRTAPAPNGFAGQAFVGQSMGSSSQPSQPFSSPDTALG
ncbi:MAG: cell division protein SepF [Elainellaceae cyanobacterium]